VLQNMADVWRLRAPNNDKKCPGRGLRRVRGRGLMRLLAAPALVEICWVGGNLIPADVIRIDHSIAERGIEPTPSFTSSWLTAGTARIRVMIPATSRMPSATALMVTNSSGLT